LGEIVRGTQICNFLGKIRPPTATKIKTNRDAVRRKNPENLQILKPQYLDLPDSVLDDFFFQIGYFSERNSDIQPLSENFAQKCTKNFRMSRPSFFCSEKKICKNKKYLPTTPAKESALIPIVKNPMNEYQTLEVWKHHTMDPIMEGILSCSLASSRGHPPIDLPLQIH
jgi:hypothetical protein